MLIGFQNVAALEDQSKIFVFGINQDEGRERSRKKRAGAPILEEMGTHP